jgi:O-antigen/teichoic acid export membrane protein
VSYIYLLDIILHSYISAIFFGYIVFGFIADYLAVKIQSKIWRKTESSCKKSGRGSLKFMQPSYREPFSWAPRTVGIIERIIYTSAIVSNQFALIGIWVALKIIGEWSDGSSNKEKDGISRVRANNFLIGTGASLIFGILGGIIFRLLINPSYLLNLIQGQ